MSASTLYGAAQTFAAGFDVASYFGDDGEKVKQLQAMGHDLVSLAFATDLREEGLEESWHSSTTTDMMTMEQTKTLGLLFNKPGIADAALSLHPGFPFFRAANGTYGFISACARACTLCCGPTVGWESITGLPLRHIPRT